MANTHELISKITVGSGGSARITFTSIPQTFTDLRLLLSARADASVGDSGYNSYVLTNAYSLDAGGRTRYIIGNPNSSVSTGTDTNNIVILGVNSSVTTAGTFANTSIYFFNYASTSQHKTVSIDQVTENNNADSYLMLNAGLYASNTAITEITIEPFGTGNFVQYTTARLYGIKNS
jgi:hypothetical protein